nr:MAG TPA: hypothetical protein [Caudoviricetes sp.]
MQILRKNESFYRGRIKYITLIFNRASTSKFVLKWGGFLLFLKI